MKNKTLEMAAKRFVRLNAEVLGEEGVVEVTSRVGRLDQSDLRGERLWDVTLMRFRYKNDEVTFLHPRLPEESSYER